MTIQFLDVGQGDAALLTTSDQHAVLLDAGPRAASGKVLQILEVVPFPLDAFLLSHAHADHMGEMDTLVSRIPLLAFFETGFSHSPSPVYPKGLAALRRRGISMHQARCGDRIKLGAYVEGVVLSPCPPFFQHTRDDINANTLVVRFDHHAAKADVRILFEGDGELPTEQRLLQHRSELRADVLKVAHHGSRFASSTPFLRAVDPRFAVISCGKHNPYGHPHPPALARLAAQHTVLARTDLEGNITVRSDDTGITWHSERTPHPLRIEQKSPTPLLVPPRIQGRQSRDKRQPKPMARRKSIPCC